MAEETPYYLFKKTSHIHFRIITESQHISSKVDLKQNMLQYLQYRQYCS